jgi:hypothetical protein
MNSSARSLDNLATNLRVRRREEESLASFVAKLVREEEIGNEKKAAEERAAARAAEEQEIVFVRFTKADWKSLKDAPMTSDTAALLGRSKIVSETDTKVVNYIVNADFSTLKKAAEEFHRDFRNLFGETGV